MIHRGESGGLVAAVPSSQEHLDSSWLNIDHFPDNHLGFADRAAEERCQ